MVITATVVSIFIVGLSAVPGYKYYYRESKSACKKSMECTPNNFQVLVKLNLYFSKFPLTMYLFRHTQKKNLTPTSRLRV